MSHYVQVGSKREGKVEGPSGLQMFDQSLNTARRSLKPSGPLCRQQSREADTSDSGRNLSVPFDMTYEDDRITYTLSEQRLNTEACGEHSSKKQLGSVWKKCWEAKSWVFQQDKAAELFFIQDNRN